MLYNISYIQYQYAIPQPDFIPILFPISVQVFECHIIQKVLEIKFDCYLFKIKLFYAYLLLFKFI